jgi:AcrR family transcriptional regulator
MNNEQIEIGNKVKDLYFRFGIKSVTMDDVARELGISKKTLYTHFKDKSELVEAVVKLEIDLQEERIDAIINKNLDAITEMFEIHKMMNQYMRQYSHVIQYDLKKYYPSVYTRILQIKRDRTYEGMKENIEKGISEGLFRKEVNPRLISKVNLIRIEGSIDTCLFTDDELTSQDVFNQLFEYHIRGIATPKGIELMDKLTNNQ